MAEVEAEGHDTVGVEMGKEIPLTQPWLSFWLVLLELEPQLPSLCSVVIALNLVKNVYRENP